MRKDMDKWIHRLPTIQNYYDAIDFQTDYMDDLCHITGYDPAILKGGQILKDNEDKRAENILTYREECFTCIYTGTKAPRPKLPWLDKFDDSKETFIA